MPKVKACEVVLYPETDWTEEKILSVIQNYRSIKEYALILHDHDTDEDGEKKKEHFHVFLHFGRTSISLDSVASWFGVGPQLVNSIRSNKYNTLLYFLHRNAPDKYQYPMDALHANFDVEAYFRRQEQKQGLDQLIERCANGEITPLNYAEHIEPQIYARHEPQFLRAWKYAADAKAAAAKGARNISVYWLSGQSGAGKSTLCRLFSEKQGWSIQFSATGSDPFSQYKGEDAFVLDDLRPTTFAFDELLKVLDPHFSAAVHSRYRDKVFVGSVIFVTTIYTPGDFLRMYALPNSESADQLFRRITELWEVDKHLVTIYTYELEHHRWEETHRLENPVGAYLCSLPKPDNSPGDSAATLNALSAHLKKGGQFK